MEVMVAVGIGSVAFMALATVSGLSSVSHRELGASMRMEEMRERITDLLNNPKAWATTVQNSANLNCLKTAGDCRALSNPAGRHPIRVFTADGHQLSDDGSNPAMGFTINGDVCQAYSPQGNSDCPFRADISWTAICPPNPAVPCEAPGARIQGVITYSPGNGQTTRLNSNIRKFNLTLGKVFSLFLACKSVQGVFNAATLRCQLSMVGKSCPTGQVVLGIDPVTHIMECGPLWTGTCPAGQVLVGVDAAGIPACKSVQCI